MKQCHSLNLFDRVGNLADHGGVATFTEVGDALDQLGHGYSIGNGKGVSLMPAIAA